MSLQAELAVRGLHLATLTHLEHFKTPSYAAHMALEILYKALPDLVDTFIEQYQGNSGKIGQYPTWSPMKRPIAELYREFIDWIDKNRDELNDGGDISLDNALADIRAAILQTLYRLNELS